MGLILKKEEAEHEVIEGIEVIERSDVPDDLPESDVELVSGKSAKEIAKTSDDADTPDDDEQAGARFDALSEKGAAEPDRFDEPGDGTGDDDGDDGSDDDTDDNASGGGDGGDGGDDDLDAADDDPHRPASLNKGIFAAILVIAVVVAAIAGYAFGSGIIGASGKGTSSITVEEDELDSVIAEYTYDGSEYSITVREAIEAEYSLETVQNDDGTYTVPSATEIIAIIRNQIMVDEATARGIEVSDDEVDEYAESILGSSDYETLATQYGVSEEQAQEIVRENAIIQKLYEQIVPDASDLTTPMAPDEPEDGDTTTASEEYAEYIIELAGDEWDSETGTWASEDGAYYAALADEDFTADSATYEQAMIAYYVAYQEYQTAYTEASETWTAFANGLFADANVTLYGLYA